LFLLLLVLSVITRMTDIRTIYKLSTFTENYYFES